MNFGQKFKYFGQKWANLGNLGLFGPIFGQFLGKN